MVSPSRVPVLPNHPVDASLHATYRRLREIPAQYNLLRERRKHGDCDPKPLMLTTRAGLVMHVMRDDIIMDILRDEMEKRSASV